MPNVLLEFEKPLVELEAKIEELIKFGSEKGIDLTDEIRTLQTKAENLKREIYGNLTPWQRINIARHPERPGAVDYIKMLFDGFIELHGDRYYGDDPAVIGGVAKFHDQPVTIIGTVKGKDTKENIACNFGYAHPEGYRKALRLMEQAEKFGRPVLTFVDTPGAYCGIGAEERGEAWAIAENLTRMATLKVPVICTITGEGGSGGALAIAVGDYIMMLENSIYSVTTPEAFATILWKDMSRAQDAAAVMRGTAKDLAQLGVIDEIIAEPLGGAHKNYQEMAKILDKSILKALNAAKKTPVGQLVKKRQEKFRGIGQYVCG